MGHDDGARPLSPREQREFDALAFRFAHDTSVADVRRRARFGMAASAICVSTAGLAIALGPVLALMLGVAALGILLGVALVAGARRRGGPPPPRREGGRRT